MPKDGYYPAIRGRSLQSKPAIAQIVRGQMMLVLASEQLADGKM